MNDWTDCDDALPEHSGYFLCHSVKSVEGRGEVIRHWFCANKQQWETVRTVTHWMPLPAPPK